MLLNKRRGSSSVQMRRWIVGQSNSSNWHGPDANGTELCRTEQLRELFHFNLVGDRSVALRTNRMMPNRCRRGLQRLEMRHQDCYGNATLRRPHGQRRKKESDAPMPIHLNPMPNSTSPAWYRAPKQVGAKDVLILLFTLISPFRRGDRRGGATLIGAEPLTYRERSHAVWPINASRRPKSNRLVLFQISDNSSRRWRAGMATIAKVEYEPRVSKCLPTEARWRSPRGAQIRLDTKEQHFKPRLGNCLSSVSNSYLSRTNVCALFST